MHRREFIKTSAIVGAALSLPMILRSRSGMYDMAGSRKIHRILKASTTKVGTLPILRAFAGNNLDYVSPYVLFDEFGPVNLNAGADPLRVDAHPHAGVTPTTYFLAGSGHHKDSLNYDFQVEKGEFMMFNSGRGAIHMEETGNKMYEEGGDYHGFQIWLNMPAKDKYTLPSTHVFGQKQMQRIQTDAYEIDVVLGDWNGAQSAIQTLVPAFYYHVKIQPNARLDIPTDPTHNAFIYVIGGSAEVEGRRELKTHHIALYERGASDINLYSPEGCEMLVLGGRPLNEPVYSYGPFVMNNEEQIKKCIKDYQDGRMGDPDQVNR